MPPGMAAGGIVLLLRKPIAALLLSIGSTVANGGLFDKPYKLRLFLSLDRQANYASTLGRQASLAFLDGGSTNPAGVGWRLDPYARTSVTASYIDAPSSKGRRVIATPVTARWKLDADESLSIAYVYTGTPDAKGNDGTESSLQSNEWIVGYSRKITGGLAGGTSLRVTSGRIVHESFAPALGGAQTRAKTALLGADLSVGLAGNLSEKLTAGLVGAYGWLKTRSTIQNVNALILPSVNPPGFVIVPPETTLDHFHDPIQNFALRAGIGIQPTEGLGLYSDFHVVHVKSHHSGSLTQGRLAVGGEYRPIARWSLRGGLGLDTDGAANWSAGLGYRFGQDIDAQVAYQSNAAPEVNPELGRTKLLAASLGLRF